MKLGLFGGTFDPIHNAHLFVAEAARVALGLERMLFLPTRSSRHRSDGAPSAPLNSIGWPCCASPSRRTPAFELDETDAICAPKPRGLRPICCLACALHYPARRSLTVRRRWRLAARIGVASASTRCSTWSKTFAIAPRADHSLDRHANALRAGLRTDRGVRARLRVLNLPGLGEDPQRSCARNSRAAEASAIWFRSRFFTTSASASCMAAQRSPGATGYARPMSADGAGPRRRRGTGAGGAIRHAAARHRHRRAASAIRVTAASNASVSMTSSGVPNRSASAGAATPPTTSAPSALRSSPEGSPSLSESATLVREQLARGGSVRYIVPEPVYRYIADHELYGRAT